MRKIKYVLLSCLLLLVTGCGDKDADKTGIEEISCVLETKYEACFEKNNFPTLYCSEKTELIVEYDHTNDLLLSIDETLYQNFKVDEGKVTKELVDSYYTEKLRRKLNSFCSERIVKNYDCFTQKSGIQIYTTVTGDIDQRTYDLLIEKDETLKDIIKQIEREDYSCDY